MSIWNYPPKIMSQKFMFCMVNSIYWSDYHLKIQKLSELLVGEFRQISGVKETQTMIAVDFEVISMATGFVLITTKPGMEKSVEYLRLSFTCDK